MGAPQRTTLFYKQISTHLLISTAATGLKYRSFQCLRYFQIKGWFHASLSTRCVIHELCAPLVPVRDIWTAFYALQLPAHLAGTVAIHLTCRGTKAQLRSPSLGFDNQKSFVNGNAFPGISITRRQLYWPGINSRSFAVSCLPRSKTNFSFCQKALPPSKAKPTMWSFPSEKLRRHLH